MTDSESTEKGHTQSEIIELVIGLLRRRRWWIILPACAVALGSIVVSAFLPNRYDSEATILVVKQRVPERYVTPTSSTDMASLDAMTQDVLSRTRLAQIIDELGLYAKQRRRLAPEELIDLMRRDVSIKPVRTDERNKDSFDALKISFTAPNPHLAQEVVSRLTTLFIQQNLKIREEQATTTTKFLREQLETARASLAEQEQRLRDFKMEHLGELPQEQQGNLSILASLETQLQNVSSNLSRALQQKLYLESMLSQYQALAPGASGVAVLGSPSTTDAPTPLESAQKRLADLDSERERLLAIYTPQHPDVVRKNHEIARQRALTEKLISKLAEGAKVQKSGSATPASETRVELAKAPARESPVVAQLRSQLDANRLEIEDLKKSEQGLKASVSQYHTRLNLTPVREQQLTSILRDYDLLKQHYADLLNKEQQSQLAATLEKQQEGQQFRLVDPPSLPTLPASPKRMNINLGGAAAGLALGLALAFLREKTDSVFHGEKAVSRHFDIPLVVGIPLLVSDRERRIRASKTVLEWVAGSALAMAVLVAEFYAFKHR